MTLFIFTVIAATQNYLRSQSKNEIYSICVNRDDKLFASKVKTQTITSIENRNSSRGFIADFVSSQASKLGQSIWENYKQQFNPNYSFAIKDEHFYNQISLLGQFDPTGINFKGFTIYRIVENKNKHIDTTLTARFVVDTLGDNINNIYNNGFFRLKLDSVSVKSTKMKISRKTKSINLDFEVIISSSFIDENAGINTDIEMGKFLVSAINLPIRNNDSLINTYNNQIQQSTNCIGQCFLIPRSLGYFKNILSGSLEKCFGNGMFSIQVAVRESAKNSIINNLLFSYN
ncbi:MAG: hypothetical protein NTZ59_11895 [Bacteroidetes bacterium]|nr:hypothetical protein [Bacteroidota bacterium]